MTLKKSSDRSLVNSVPLESEKSHQEESSVSEIAKLLNISNDEFYHIFDNVLSNGVFPYPDMIKDFSKKIIATQSGQSVHFFSQEHRLSILEKIKSGIESLPSNLNPFIEMKLSLEVKRKNNIEISSENRIASLRSVIRQVISEFMSEIQINNDYSDYIQLLNTQSNSFGHRYVLDVGDLEPLSKNAFFSHFPKPTVNSAREYSKKKRIPRNLEKELYTSPCDAWKCIQDKQIQLGSRVKTLFPVTHDTFLILAITAKCRLIVKKENHEIDGDETDYSLLMNTYYSFSPFSVQRINDMKKSQEFGL